MKDFNRIAPTSKGPGIVPVHLSRAQLVRLLDMFLEIKSGDHLDTDLSIFNNVRGTLLITLEGDIQDIEDSSTWNQDPDKQAEEIQYLSRVIAEIRAFNPLQEHPEPIVGAEPPIADVNDHRGWADFMG